MGKEKPGFLSPKAISNRIKAKGLQKLRWYCQMCQKQCRDENGFKCHTTSEAHQRQLLLFAEDSDKYLDYFSKGFLEDYLELLRHRFGTKRVSANLVYQEYIGHKDHVHMNSTQWETLTEFVKWAGREGHCAVDQTEKGWFISYVDRDPETIKRQESLKAKEKLSLDDEEKLQRFLSRQMERATAASAPSERAYTELQRDEEDEKVAFSLAAAKKASKPTLEASALTSVPGSSRVAADAQAKERKSKDKPLKRKSALDDIIASEEATKEKRNRKENWLHPNIVVKVVTKRLGEKYHNKKAVIQEVKDRFTAVIKMQLSGDVIKVDQTHLQTVIPAVGRPVLVVNGAYRGQKASLLSLSEKKFCCSVEIATGLLKGRVVEGIAYEDFSKLEAS